MSETATKRVTGRTTAKRAATPTPHAIAERAYARYVERGCVDGHDLEDWFVAERELADAPAPRRPRKAAAAAAA
jgi:hypothetical protein